MKTRATSYRGGRLEWPGTDLDRLAGPALGVAVIASGLVLLHLTRATSFWADDWTWIANRRSNTVDAFMAPYNGHLSLVPVAIYRLMFAIFGIGSYTPYRAVVIVLSLVVAVLVFAYARARAGELVALLLAVSMLFLGPGWQDTMWAFQIPWLLVCIAGITALLLLEHRTRRADIAACAVLLLAICSTSLGLAFAIGIAVDLALTRRRWRDAWIVAIPLVLYAIWALHYRPSQIDLAQIPTIPVSVAQAAAIPLSVLAGLSGIAPFDATGTSLIYGWPLLGLALAFVIWRAQSTRIASRVVSLAATLVAFAASVSIVHGAIASVLSSRYVYVYCLLAALLIAELARGVALSRLAQGSLLVLGLGAVLSNFGSLRSFGAYFRSSGATTDGALTALDLDRGRVGPNTIARVALYQFVKLTARSYFTAERALGSPAYTVAQLRHADTLAQSAADSQLLADGDVTLTSESASTRAHLVAATAPEPSLAALANASVTRDGPCLRFTPAAALAPGSVASASLTLPAGRLSVAAGAAPVTVSVRRFAPTLTPLGSVAARRAAVVTIRPDAAPDGWSVQLSSIAPVSACTLPR